MNKQPNAFTIGYGGPPIKIPTVRKPQKRGLSVSLKSGPIPILRPTEAAARKAALNSQL